MKKWLRFKLLNWAAHIIHKEGYVVARIVTRGGINYIEDTNGALHRIGGKNENHQSVR